MMVLIFVLMAFALGAGLWGPRWVAVTASLACLALSTALFLYEIDSPDYGFRMPWLQGTIDEDRPVSGRPSA